MCKTDGSSSVLPAGAAVWALLAVVVLSGCESSYQSHDARVKMAMAKIDYADGISEQEAGAIADAYLLLHGRYKDRAMFARIADAGEAWTGKVYASKSLASPVDADLPLIVVDKKSGKISWPFGPTLERIDLEVLDKAEPALAPYQAK